MEIKEPAHTFPATERLGAGITGLFLMCFGTPFTLVPFLILPDIMSANSIGPTIFALCFTIPFVIAGLAVQYAGYVSLRLALFPKSGSIPWLCQLLRLTEIAFIVVPFSSFKIPQTSA